MNQILSHLLFYLKGDFIVMEGAVLLQILILFLAIYWTMRLLKGAPGLLQLGVIIITLTVLHLLADAFRLQEIEWLLEILFKSLPVIIVILFADEIRKVFAKFTRLLQSNFFLKNKGSVRYTEKELDSLCFTLQKFSSTKTGALIAMVQNTDLEQISQTGKLIDAEFGNDNELLETIFYKGSPLHDGGVIINRRIEAAACTFPLSKDPLQSSFGLRHRAALGLSQQSDAVVLVVSEETGAIHCFCNGIMTAIFTNKQLRELLHQHFIFHEQKHKSLFSLQWGRFCNSVRSSLNWFSTKKSSGDEK